MKLEQACDALVWEDGGKGHNVPKWISPIQMESFHPMPLTAELQATFDANVAKKKKKHKAVVVVAEAPSAANGPQVVAEDQDEARQAIDEAIEGEEVDEEEVDEEEAGGD